MSNDLYKKRQYCTSDQIKKQQKAISQAIPTTPTGIEMFLPAGVGRPRNTRSMRKSLQRVLP